MVREQTLRGLVLTGVAVCLATEVLSPFHLLRRGPVIACWLIFLLAAALRIRPRLPRFRVELFSSFATLGIVVIVLLTALTAIVSPPNSADAMAYHLPRVVYWAQSGSVAFFPTPYLNQISLAPLAEYFMLHGFVITGGDRLVNLVALLGFIGSIIGVSAIAGAFGLGARGQACAALLCATLPNGILQASGAKNDWLLTLWLLAMVYFAARRDAPFLGLAAGLAIATKATAYLFAPPLLAVLVAWNRRTAAWLAAGILLLNGPQYLRNIALSGKPLGYDSAQGDGLFRWRNEHPGWKSTASNVLRNASEQVGGRSPAWNQRVFDTVVRVHSALGIDPQDPDTTFRWSRYEAPRNANHEANANNRWHLALFVLAALAAVFARSRPWTLYSAALLAGFLLFCFYLKWQPFLGRLELPLFVLAAPLGGWLLQSLRPSCVALAICLFFLTSARLPLLENWTRPLRGPHSLFATRREDNYFNDMGQWDNRSSYLEAVDRTARSGCDTVGLDISENQLEYPFQALLRARRPSVRFQHEGVVNASARYDTPGHPAPCAVLCLDCAGNRDKLSRYYAIGLPVSIGHFVLFLP